MAKTGSTKSASYVAVILCAHLLTVSAQRAGFLSIDCGGKINHSDVNNIAWFPDANYIGVGQTANTENTALPSYLQTLRFFPKPLRKSCYTLPVFPNVPCLLRLWFPPGNYTGFPQFPISFAYSVETTGLLFVRNVTLSNTVGVSTEKIFVSSGHVLYVCLIRTSETDNPVINAIELRTLRDGMYPEAKPGKMLTLNQRYDLGGILPVRYPQDDYDRVWNIVLQLSAGIEQIASLHEPISENNTVDLPPTIVMRTAVATKNSSFEFTIDGSGKGGNHSLLLLYFAEIGQLNMTETRSFNILINDKPDPRETISIVRNYSATEVRISLNITEFVFTLEEIPMSSYGPILNAFEHYVIIRTDQATDIQDIEALNTIKTWFDIKGWISDPCHVVDWDGIGCDNSSPFRRISEMNLSGMNLTGSLPLSIGNLTALVNLSLDRNHLTGPLPIFTKLTMLERLHLQNNSLSGTIPDWLADLKNLTELFIDNNNFSGVIPPQLLKPSLEIRCKGNRYLSLPPIPPNLPSNIASKSDKNRLRWIHGLTISGILAVNLLVLIVGIVAHRKKSRRKENSKVEKESKHAVEDNSMIVLPNTTKSHAFTLDEIMTATENFSHKIGQGGFGSVFFGKLEQGTDIAVKVLSLFSKQGVQEFLNKVDLLSRVHHRNLVSLLGYCNESRELMLVYEHMSGGSLKDHLYGPTAQLSQLNWKDRLKIASDAAQGLEYLHVGCTPKIIHRDIKTANILLDRNFNGKLADLGLSRVTIDGETSHVTTTVKGTLGYLDPEYFSTQMLTEKSDLYSFGVVLLEIICGRQPINAKLCGEQLNLIRWVTPYVEMDENPAKLAEIIDKRLGINYDIKSISNVAKLAIRCVQAEPSSRPHVSVVVAELKEAIKLENDKASLISEIDIAYGDLSVISSEPKEMESAESSSSKIATVTTEGR